MATVRTSLSLYDGMTQPLQGIHNALSIVLNSFEAVQTASGNAVDVSSIQAAREELAKAGASLEQMENSLRRADRAEDQLNGSIRDAGQAQNQFNNRVQAGTNAVDALGSKLKGVLATVMSIAGVKMALGWVKENFELSDIQRNAENQLKIVLANMGANDIEIPVTANTDAVTDALNQLDGTSLTLDIQADAAKTISAYDAITQKASEIQGKGIYGDEAMIAGAAELATYFSDTEAILSMMDTLSHYAMGMSGGGAVDATAMVDYATGIGKLMTGSYGAMTKKGFEFTDAQKAVIEGTATEAQVVEALGAEYLDMSTDMQAAAAINSVIGEAWDGLYEKMSDTPEGKIIQFNNTLGDLRETLGNRVYPAALNFFDVFTNRFPDIERVLNAFADGCSALIVILTWLAGLALDIAAAVVDHWGMIAPVIGGIASALLIYNGYLMVTNTLETISNGLKAVAAARSALKSGLTLAEAAATTTATGAQVGMNAAMLACPITWIVIGIIAIIAVIYAAVTAYNKFANASVSATGIVAGAFAVLGAFLFNSFLVPVQNGFAAFANFIGNVFNNPIAAVKVAFYDMCLTVIGYIRNLAHGIETLLNKIPGVTVSITGGLDNFYSSLQSAQQKVKDESGWVEYVKKLDFIDYSDAASAGYNFGKGVEDKVSGMFQFPELKELDYEDLLSNRLDDISQNASDTAANTAATADALDYAEEDLAYLRDIAEREAINRFTTAEIKIEQNNTNYVDKDTDIDGIMDIWMTDFAQKLDISGEGVHF